MNKVLMFHRVLPQKLILQNNSYSEFGTLISIEYFDEILKFIISKNIEVVTITELTIRLQNEQGIKNHVALTFDDGYSDNFDYVFPLLEKYNLTATFYPLVRPCIENTVIPLDIYYQCVDGLDLTKEQRIEYIFGKTKKYFYESEPAEQYIILNEIFKSIPNEYKVKYMTNTQIKNISDNGFEIGSHGMTHAILTANYMNKNKIVEELGESKKMLEVVINKQVNSFCFPSGKYNPYLVDIARQIGYTSTCIIKRCEAESLTIPTFERFYVMPNSHKDLINILN